MSEQDTGDALQARIDEAQASGVEVGVSGREGGVEDSWDSQR